MSEALQLHALPRRFTDGEHLSDAPDVWLFENFANAEEMAALLEAAYEKLRPAQVSGNKRGYISSGRSGSNCWVAHDHDGLTLQLARRISQLAGIPLSHAESFQIVHYGPEEEYRSHYDAWDHGTERGDRCMAKGGQRLVTTLLYLNHVEAGGATGFPRLDLKVHPVPGNLLLFHNCHPGTVDKHENSLHGGLPVADGEKWAANLWFRERRYR